MKKSLTDIFKLMDTGYRKNGIAILGLLIISSILDFFGIAFFVPIISLLVDPGAFINIKLSAFLPDVLETMPPTSLTITFTGAILLFIVAKSVFQIWITKRKALYAYSVGRSLASKALDRLVSLDYHSFASSAVSPEINMISNLPLIISNNIIIAAGTLFSEVIVFILLLTAIAIYNLKVFSFLLIVLLPMMLIYRVRRKLLKSIGTRLRSSYTSMAGDTINLVQGLPDVRAYGKEDYFKGKVLTAYEELIWVFGKDHSMQSSTSRLTEILAAWCVCMIIVYAVFTGQDTKTTLLLLGIYAGVCFRLIPSVNRILASLQQIKMHEQSVVEFTGKMTDMSVARKEEQVDFQQQIVFDNISFSYVKDSSLLRNISLKIRKGERVAFTGKSGTGKTTLMLLLMRFLREQSGNITVDGTSLSGNSWRVWGNRIGYVPQAPFIFNGTIAENIAFGHSPEEIDADKISELVRKLGMDDFTKLLVEGIHTKIGERGMKISGGQRQRIAIARALYNNAEILLLDEVTNQLDPSTEREVLTTLLDVADLDQTIIMITHQNSVLQRFDTIYDFADGAIALRKFKRGVEPATL